MNSVFKPLALCAFLVANVLQLTAQCTVVAAQPTTRILYTSPVFIPPTWVNPSARLPSGALVYATGTYVDRIKSRLNPICDSLVYTVSVVADASCRVPDSLRLIKIHQLVTNRGAITGWNLLTPYNTWNGVVMNAAGCVDSVKIQKDTTICVQRGGNHTVTLHVLPSLPGAEYAWYRRGQLVALTTDRVLTINNIQPSDTGSYSVKLTVPGLPVGVINGVQVKFCCVPSTSHTYRTVSQGTSVAWCNQNYASTGNYTCTLQNVNGCDSFAILHLTVLPCNMTVTIAQFGNQLNALAQGGVRPYRYRWSTGDTTSSIPLNGSGNYTVTVIDGLGCSQVATGAYNPIRSDYRLDSMTVPCNSSVGSGCTPILLKTSVTGVKAYTIRLKFDATKVMPDSIIKHTLGSIIPTGANLFQYVSGDTLTLIITLTSTQDINGVVGDQLICISWSSVSNFVPNLPVFYINGTIQEETATVRTIHPLESTGRIISASSILLWNLYHGTQLMTFSSATNPTTILSGTLGNMVQRGIFSSGGTFLLSPLRDNYLQIKRNSTSILGMPAIGGLDARYTSMIIANRTLPNRSGLELICALIAMDVDGDGSITGRDITYMQNRAINDSTGFHQSNRSGKASWRHFPKSWTFPTGKRAFQLSATFPADDGVGISQFRVPQIDDIFQPDAAYLQRCDTTSMDIVSILLGDADNNYLLDPNAGAKGKMVTNITIDGRNATRSNNAGRDTFRIPVYADSTMGGLDLKIENYSNNMEILSVVKGHSSVELLASINAANKTCYISAYSTAQDGTSANTPLCYINVITNCIFPNQFGQVTGYLDGKKSGTAITLNICTPDEDLHINKFQIFPNPTSNTITVQHEELTPNTIQVYNILGRLMSEVQAGNGSTMVDLTDFAKGVYLIKVDNYTQRVVKQ